MKLLLILIVAPIFGQREAKNDGIRCKLHIFEYLKIIRRKLKIFDIIDNVITILLIKCFLKVNYSNDYDTTSQDFTSTNLMTTTTTTTTTSTTTISTTTTTTTTITSFYFRDFETDKGEKYSTRTCSIKNALIRRKELAGSVYNFIGRRRKVYE